MANIMPKILITGKGLVAEHLSARLIELGHNVSFLSRRETDTEKHIYKWDINKGYIDPKALVNVNTIVHLAGANIGAKRWTNERKELIISSRVDSAKLLLTKINEYEINLDHFVSASAVGFYGAQTSDTIFTENDSPINDFLSKVCQKWEQSADQFSQVSNYVTKLRIGVVLSPNGGALDKMLAPIKMGLGSPLGSGNQYLPWIHIDDLIGIFIHILENKLSGAYNAVAPEHITNKEFLRQCAKILKKPFFMPKVPEFVLRLALGEMSEMITKGSRVSSKKIQSSGYNYQYSDLISALKDIFK